VAIQESVQGPGAWYIVDLPEAHNGLLEMLLEIGLLGTSLFIFILARNFALAIKCMNGPAGRIGLTSVLLLLGVLVTGFSEEVLLAAQQIWTGLFFMVGFMCEEKLRLARVARTKTDLTAHRPPAHVRV
jgi:exopolysaccharide production protein ExoQ